MGKFTFLFCGCLLAASSIAASTTAPRYERQIAKAMTAPLREGVAKPANAIEPKSEIRRFNAGSERIAKAPAETDIPEIITQAPAGTTVTYSKESAGYFPYMFWLMEYDEDCAVAEIVFTDNDEVYFKDIFSYAQNDTYVKGTLSDGIITVEMGQCIYYSTRDEYGCKLAALSVDENGYPYVNESVDKVTYTVDTDGTVKLSPEYILGLAYTDDDSWANFADFTQTYTVFTDTPVTKPASVTTEKWALTTADGNGHIINVGIDGNDIYFGGLSDKMPDAWAKGTIDGDKVTVDEKQFMGIYGNMYQYLMIGASEEEDGEKYYKLTSEPMVFNYDANAKTLTTAEEKALIVNASLKKVYYLTILGQPTMYFLDKFEPAVPSNPTNVYTDGYSPYSGCGTFEFTLPILDTDGKLLDSSCYYYNIYVDNYLFTLYPDEYSSIADDGYEELTDIPYDYSDYWDLEVSGANRTLYYYFEGFETIGVQAIYTVDGITNKSALVNYNIETGQTNEVDPASISVITSTGKAVNVEYYDLMGRKLANPATGGMVIKRTTYSDGSVKSYKCILK